MAEPNPNFPWSQLPEDIRGELLGHLPDDDQVRLGRANKELGADIGQVDKPGVRVAYNQAELEEFLADADTLEIHLDANLDTVFEIVPAHAVRSTQVPIRALGTAQVRVSGGRIIAHDNAHVIEFTQGRVFAFDSARVSQVVGGDSALWAYDSSTVSGVTNGAVWAYESATVTGVTGGTVWAYDTAHVDAAGFATIFLHSPEVTYTAATTVTVAQEY